MNKKETKVMLLKFMVTWKKRLKNEKYLSLIKNVFFIHIYILPHLLAGFSLYLCTTLTKTYKLVRDYDKVF